MVTDEILDPLRDELEKCQKQLENSNMDELGAEEYGKLLGIIEGLERAIDILENL